MGSDFKTLQHYLQTYVERITVKGKAERIFVHFAVLVRVRIKHQPSPFNEMVCAGNAFRVALLEIFLTLSATMRGSKALLSSFYGQKNCLAMHLLLVDVPQPCENSFRKVLNILVYPRT